MTIKLEVGKKYVLNNGEVHMCETGCISGFKIDGLWYYEDGAMGLKEPHYKKSVSHEYVEGKTINDLDVNVGDVVECLDNLVWRASYTNGETYTIGGYDDQGVIVNGYEKCGLFRIVSRAFDNPTLWRDMTSEEKGALLLANEEGEVIESWVGGKWEKVSPLWAAFHAYRIKPAPKVVTVELYGHPQGGFFLRPDTQGDTHRITFQAIDGKPDPETIKIESL